jgi:hypothetical protein
VTEGSTLLPPLRGDKRTKEVFVLSLERMTGFSGRALDRAMHAMDEGLSEASMVPGNYCRFGNSPCPELLLLILLQPIILAWLSGQTVRSRIGVKS